MLLGLLTILPSVPTTVHPSGIFFKTTELAPILTLLPISIDPNNLAPAPITTPFPIVGCLLPVSLPVPPKVTP